MATLTHNAASVFEDYSSAGYGNRHSAFDRHNATFGWAFRRKLSRTKFECLIESRIEYLESLKTLREDWISGASASPSREVIESSKKILRDFASWLETNKTHTPKLVMGPIPTGGISIEFTIEERFTIFLNLYNDSSVEMTVEDMVDGDFIEIETAENSVEYLLKNAYFHFDQ